MRYSQFEQLVLGIGGVAILATTLLTVGQGFDSAEFGAQILLLLVLIGAVHWGRRGGFVAALLASLIYVILRVPLIQETGLTTDIALMLLARIIAFGLVGIGGAEVCVRIKYVLARLQNESGVDEWSGVYNQRLAARLLTGAVARCERYGEPYCVVTVALSPSLTTDLRDSRRRSLVRSVANHVRNDVRMVDEVARLDDGRFLVLLPHSLKKGGVVVRNRLSDGVRQVAGAHDEAVEIKCLAGIEDADAIDALLASITPADEVPAQPDSDASKGPEAQIPAGRRNDAAASTPTPR